MPIDPRIKESGISLLIASILFSLMFCNPFSKENLSGLERVVGEKIVQNQISRQRIDKEDLIKMQKIGPNTYYDIDTNTDYLIDIEKLEIIYSLPREPTYLPPKTF